MILNSSPILICLSLVYHILIPPILTTPILIAQILIALILLPEKDDTTDEWTTRVAYKFPTLEVDNWVLP